MVGAGAYGRVYSAVLCASAAPPNGTSSPVATDPPATESGGGGGGGGGVGAEEGGVALAKARVADTSVAVKEFKEGLTGKARVHFLQEAALLAQFDHRNIVHLIGAELTADPLLIIIELCECSLLSKLRAARLGAGPLTRGTKMAAARDVARGMHVRFSALDVAWPHFPLCARGLWPSGPFFDWCCCCVRNVWCPRHVLFPRVAGII
jgi:serine/threonine protein kinase